MVQNRLVRASSKGEKAMRKSTKNIFKGMLSLTAAMVLGAAMQFQARSADEVRKPLLLTQKAEMPKEKQAAEAARAKEAEQKQRQQRKAQQPEKRLKQKTRKIEGSSPPPDAAGTKKIAGQILRDKEAPGEE
ncbi:MAG: hypothetical protein NTW80_09210 [Deltaproteobacteria bacterium]|nr:hypothetical protein [Deltaproteobacteria bacterium]